MWLFNFLNLLLKCHIFFTIKKNTIWVRSITDIFLDAIAPIFITHIAKRVIFSMFRHLQERPSSDKNLEAQEGQGPHQVLPTRAHAVHAMGLRQPTQPP